MRDAAPQTVHLSDYTPYPWTAQSVELHFTLAPSATRVRSTIAFVPNPAGALAREMLLHGEELTLIWARIDGQPVTPTLTAEGLTVDVPEGPFTWEAEVEVDPAGNTALEGLYMSNGMYCTQCEAEGFRKITYYPDRPDVMSVFTVTIEGPHPVLLSNGNPISSPPTTSNGTTHGPNPPICLRWSRVIWSPITIPSRPRRAAPSISTSTYVRATRGNAPSACRRSRLP